MLATVLITPLFASPTRARDQVSLQLKWMHQLQSAGYYAAVEKGFYRESGLEVEIREGGPAVDANATMAAGSADFGICTNSPLLNKDQGANTILLAVIFQHSATTILTLDHSGIRKHFKDWMMTAW
jgi:ABC-type nitrate/sulfonate/bicarbonate transport system substrate-binding protein